MSITVPIAGDERRRMYLLTTLTFVTGMVDGVGFVGLDHVFGGTATGNILILGMALGGGADLPIVGPLAALVTFSLGAMVAGMLLRGHPGRDWVGTITAILVVNAVVLAGLAGLLAITQERFVSTVQVTVSSVTALVMGAQAVIARRMAVAEMNTIVITLSLVAWVGDSLVRPGTGIWNRRIVVVLVLFLGALVGVALMRVHIGVPMALAAALVMTIAVIGHRTFRTGPGAHVGRWNS
jgi:uncharacterized membrane protein YoaK (UPF0700 family)